MTPFDQLFSLMKKPWAIASYALLVLLSYYFLDKSVAWYCYHLQNEYPAWPVKFITHFGKWSPWCAFLAVSGLFFRFIIKNKTYEQRAWYLLVCVGLANLLVTVVKITVSRARPELLFQHDQFGFYWFKMNNLFWSFPSGHSIVSGALAAGLTVLYPRYWLLFFSGAFLVIASRILLTCHYISDVMTGFYLSILIVGFLTQSFKKHQVLIFSMKSKSDQQ